MGAGGFEVVVVRHGETAWSAEGRHTSTTDLPLTSRGEEQARRLGEALKGRSFALVLTSPKRRARQTCALAGRLEEAVVMAELEEWGYGAVEGLTTEEARQATGDQDWSVFTGLVEGGETPGEVGRRADAVLAAAAGAGGDVLCFGHGHHLRVLAARWLGLPPVAGRLLVLSAGSLGRLGWERSVRVLSCWNVAP